MPTQMPHLVQIENDYIQDAVTENAKLVDSVLSKGLSIALLIVLVKFTGASIFTIKDIDVKFVLDWAGPIFIGFTIMHGYTAYLLSNSISKLRLLRPCEVSQKLFQKITCTGGAFFRGMKPRVNYHVNKSGGRVYEMEGDDPTTWFEHVAAILLLLAIVPFKLPIHDWKLDWKTLVIDFVACIIVVANWIIGSSWAIKLSQLTLEDKATIPEKQQDKTYEYQNSVVAFQWREATTQPWAELLTADPEQLRPLCQTLFDTQINPGNPNPYIDPASLTDIPHRFLSGSEDELRRLTLAIVQTDPDVFANSLEPVTITYRAQTPTKRAGTTRMLQGKQQLAGGRIPSLCDLALRLNTFVGLAWKPRPPYTQPNRLGHFDKQIHRIIVTAQPPSAHERAESLLILADWLEGKVREPKRLHWLGID